MTAGSIVVSLTASTGSFVSDMNRAGQEADRLGKSIERQIKILEQQALYAGKSADEVVKLKLAQKGATEEQLGRAQTAIDARITAENAAAVQQTIAALKHEAEWAGKTANEIKVLELAQKGATREQQATATAAMQARDALERQAAVVKKLADLKQAAALAGKSSDEKTLINLQQEGATPRQLGEARSSINAKSAAENAAAVKKEVEELQKLASQAGKTAEELKLLQLVEDGATAAQLAAAEAAQKQAAVLNKLADLKKQASLAGLSEKDAALKMLTEQGATAAQLQDARGFFDEKQHKDNQAAIEKEIEALKKLALQAGLTADQKKLLELADRGATKTQLEAIEADQKRTKALNEQAVVAERLIEMERAVSEIGLSANEKELRALGREGATTQQIDKARDIQAMRDAETEATKRAEAAEKALANIRASIQGKQRDDYLSQQRAAEAAATEKAANWDRALENIRASIQGKQRDDYLAQQREAEAAAAKKAEAAELALANIRVAAQQQEKSAYQEGEAFVASVKSRAEAIGKLGSELLEMKAAQLGVSEKAAPFIAKLKESEQGIHGFGKNANLTRQQMIFAGVQLKDFFESILAGQSPMTAFLQQGATTVSVFGGFKNTFAAIASVLTPTVIGLGSVAAAIGIMAYAAFKGRSEAKELADALTLTGNTAGLTKGSFSALAESISASGGRAVGSVREIGLAIAKTGQIGPASFASATEAAERFSEATGKSADETAQAFARWRQDPLTAAKELTQQYGLLNLAQYEHVRALQEQGRGDEAFKIVTDALNERLKGLDKNLGYIDLALKKAKESWSAFWNAAKGLGVPEQVEEKLAELQKKLEEKKSGKVGGRSSVGTSESEKEIGRLQSMADYYQKQGLPGQIIADLEAMSTEDKKKAGEATVFVEGIRSRIHALDQMEKSVAEVTRQIDEYNRAASEMSEESRKANGVRPITEEERQRAIFETRRQTIDPRIAAGVAANLEASLKAIDQAQQREQNDLAAHNQQLQTLYQAGYTSLSKYYDDRRDVIQAGAEIEAGVLEKRAQAQREALAATPLLEPAEIKRRTSEIADLEAKAAEARRKAGQEITQSLLEQAIAFRQLTQDMREYQASILQLQGRDFEAAGLRTANVIERQRELLTKASGLNVSRGPQDTGDFARFDRDAGAQATSIAIADQERRSKQLLEVQNSLNEAQKQQGLIAERSDIAQQLFMLNATRSGMTLRDQEQELGLLRGQSLMQMEKLYDKYQSLQDAAHPDAPINQFLARLRLEIEKLKESVDPLQERLNALTDSLAGGVASSMTDSLTNVNKLFDKRRDDAKKEVDDKRKQYDDDIANLQTYLARSHDKQEQARLRERIAQKQSARDAIDVSGFAVALKTLERDVVGPILKQIQQTAMKALVTDPLEQELKGMFRGFTKDNIGAIGGGFGGIFGSIGQWIQNKFSKPISPKELEQAQAAQEAFRRSELGDTQAISAAADVQAAAKAAADVAPTTFAERLLLSGTNVSEAFGKVTQSATLAAEALGKLGGDASTPSVASGVGGDLGAYLDQRAGELGIPTSLARALVSQESGGNPNAVSPKGARGITQVMPGTMREMGYDPTTATPENYVDAGMRYLKKQYDKFGQWDLALAAYHAGPGNVQRAGGIPNTSDGLSTTADYVSTVLRKSGIDKTGLLSQIAKPLIRDVGGLFRPGLSKDGQAFETAKESFRASELGDATKAQADAAKRAGDSIGAMGTGVDEATKAITSMGSESSIASQIMGLLPQAGATPATAAMVQLTAAAQSAAAAMMQMAGSSAASAGGSFLPGIGALSGGAPSGNVPIFSPDGVWDDGGFTGHGGKHDVAGLVHRGEFVNRQEVVRQPGAREFLERFNVIGMDALRGFADGGYVGSSSPIIPQTSTRTWPAPPPDSARPLPNVTIVNNTGTPAKGRAERRPDGGLAVIIDAMKDEFIGDMNSGGRYAKAHENTFGTRRAPQLFR